MTLSPQVSRSDGMASCRASCGACEACTSENDECYHRNRRKGGFLDLDAEMLAEIESV